MQRGTASVDEGTEAAVGSFDGAVDNVGVGELSGEVIGIIVGATALGVGATSTPLKTQNSAGTFPPVR